MKEFFEFAEREDFQRLLAQATKYPSVQGVTIDYDPVWLHLARLRQQLPSGPFDHVMNYILADMVRGWSWTPRLWNGQCAVIPNDSNLFHGPLDTAWLPPWWKRYNEFFDRPAWDSPIIVRICLLPWSRQEETIRFGEYPFPIVFERRPQAQLCHLKTPQAKLHGGLSIGVGAGDSGTLGGIVKDQHGTLYGVTCAHVVGSSGTVEQPAQCDHPSPNAIGDIAASSTLQTSQFGTPCNPKNNQSVMNRVDAALIELDDQSAAELKIANLGSLTRVLPEADLQPGSSISFVGKESGPPARQLIIGGLNVTFRFKNASGDFLCFENTFQVRWPNAGCPVGVAAVEQGDSGAWLCTPDGNGFAWAGMVMGSDQFIGYGVFAEAVTNWASALSSPLQLGVV
jgi:hypothetical protein